MAKPDLGVVVPQLGVVSQNWAVSQAAAIQGFHPTILALRHYSSDGSRGLGHLGGGDLDRRVQFENPRTARTLEQFARMGVLRPRLASKCDVLLFHFVDTLLNWRWILRDDGAPTFCYLHGIDAIAPAQRRLTGTSQLWGSILERRMEWARKRTHGWIATSQYIAGVAIESWGIREAVHVNHLGLDLREFDGDPLAANRQDVLFVGRLIPRKGALTLIQAWSRIAPSHMRHRLLIVGRGPDEVALREFVRGTGIERVHFLGALAPAEVRERMRRATVVAVPSHDGLPIDSEGFGMVSIEAQACGAPVVVCESGGLPETLMDRSLAIKSRDIPALASALDRVLSDSRRARKDAVASRAWVRTHFDVRQSARRLEDLMTDRTVSPSA